MPHGCSNCGSPETESYELSVQSGPPTEVSLCSECHASLEAGFVWAG